MNPLFLERLTECLEVVKAQGLASTFNGKPMPWHYAFELMSGPKYTKVAATSTLQKDTAGEGRRVFLFVENATGDIFKPASWNAPAKGARYSLADEASFLKMKAAIGWCNGFLYR
jgi:hypothetical protein